MKRAGRAHWLVIAGIASALVALYLVFSGGDSAESAGSAFMDALARQDVEALVQMSDLGARDEAKVREQWKYSVQVAGEHYQFKWRPTGIAIQSPEQATFKMMFAKNAEDPMSYEEPRQFVLRKVNGKWKVQLDGLDRQMYPALPR